MMNKQLFEIPEMEVIRLSNGDIIITSIGIELPDTEL